MDKIIIAGGTGFLGTVLTSYFQSKAEKISILTRTPQKNTWNIQYIYWNARTMDTWVHELENADVLINMTGKSVDCRYTKKNKERILKSRVESTAVLNQAVSLCKKPPKVWLNSSTATIYKHSLDKEMDETLGEYGTGFSVSVAKAWEQTFFEQKISGVRKVALRTAIVLGKKGGALRPLINLTKISMGGKQASGKQKISWIHELDFARSIEFIIEEPKIEGVINIVAPQPTTNTQFMHTLRNALGIRLGIPLPLPLLKIGARIIQTETELITKSRNVIPKNLLDYGFTFEYPMLTTTLQHLTAEHS